jgi:CheY-like chemotaxis protein
MRRVYVVEDDDSNAIVFRRVLERRGGWEVVVTESADELIAAVRSGAADLVLMDVSLVDTHWQGRRVNGTELCRVLKSDPATASVPVVLATAHAMRGDADRLMVESGADDYASKPIVDHAAFIAQIARLLGEAA